MATYWIAFRITDDATYSYRYDALMEAIRTNATKWWTDPTSFIVFSSERSIDDIAAVVEEAIDPSSDVALIGKSEFKTARLVGTTNDHDIFELIPFAKKT